MRIQRSSHDCRWLHVLIAACALLIAGATHAHDADDNAKSAGPARFESSTSQRSQIIRAIAANDLTKAGELLDAYLQDHADDDDMLYTAAGVQAQLGNIDRAEKLLLASVEAGFREFRAMERDPDLIPLRDTETFKAILEANRIVRTMPGEKLFERWTKDFGTETYRLDSDDKRHLYYASSLDETTHREVRAMLEAEADHLAATLFGDVPGYAVLIAMPTPAHARQLLGADNIGGMYFHYKRELITRDVGGSLRHEFVHLMHYGHMERLKQKHPLWIQEGLASLYEDYRLDSDGTIEFLPNERQAVAKANARGRHLADWDELFAMSDKQFMREAAKMYAQVRSMFEFIAEKGVLEEWYASYTAGFVKDQTGRRALEDVFHMPIADVERLWRAWLISRPDVATGVRPGSASLGIRYQPNGVSDGVLVMEVFPESAASAAGVHHRDVIVAFDGEPVRSGQELTIRIASKSVGEWVSLRVRRDGRYLDLSARLQAYGRRRR